MSETRDGKKTLYAGGTFADDPARAAAAAAKALRKFCEQTGIPMPSLDGGGPIHLLPLRLRTN